MGEGANRGITQFASTDIMRTLWTKLNTVVDQIMGKVGYPGHYDGSTDTQGYVVIAHNLGFTPSAVVATSRKSGGAVATVAFQVLGIDSVTNTSFRVRMAAWRPGSGYYYIDTPDSIMSCAFDWVAYR